MSIPSAQDLSLRQDNARAQLKKLQQAYSLFLEEWEKLEEQERSVFRVLADHIDKKQIHSVNKKINSIIDSL
ncbi:MAG: hypothetical protein A3B90_01860 [Candidatus Magasanikbacteria bacterium RIFCSPHIGHO2_02_FULL_41_13]|uniref:Uncharacterized protein n=1 Tax=Candidatus Magasanikbacteria bacterium RIFCSPHIGHO2_02_FULL_41_13 TaxID=1798676 RepID=A0A1F6M760_9BACT|nr:MAG: hypothetical protein A3B90_01860 [Candidatus Magasanikbacteria bacterium RIFCSPHIGHO2_02_FULL_41_13]